MITGQSVTGILHLINQTPFDWYSKKPATVETITYSSEFTAACLADDQIITNHHILCYLGVSIKRVTFLFRENKLVVDSSTISHAKLHKWHNFLSFHHVTESIAAKQLNFVFLPGNINPADILSKYWGYQQIKTSLNIQLIYLKNDNLIFYGLITGGVKLIDLSIQSHDRNILV